MWSCQTGSQLLEFIEESFPQISDLPNFIKPEEADEFARGKPGKFPMPQFVPRLTASSGETELALLGDAAHAFPPDVGQGVNSALEDVISLMDILKQGGALPDKGKGGGDEWTEERSSALQAAVEEYNKRRAPAAEAIARIVQVASDSRLL